MSGQCKYPKVGDDCDETSAEALGGTYIAFQVICFVVGILYLGLSIRQLRPHLKQWNTALQVPTPIVTYGILTVVAITLIIRGVDPFALRGIYAIESDRFFVEVATSLHYCVAIEWAFSMIGVLRAVKGQQQGLTKNQLYALRGSQLAVFAWGTVSLPISVAALDREKSAYAILFFGYWLLGIYVLVLIEYLLFQVYKELTNTGNLGVSRQQEAKKMKRWMYGCLCIGLIILPFQFFTIIDLVSSDKGVYSTTYTNGGKFITAAPTSVYYIHMIVETLIYWLYRRKQKQKAKQQAGLGSGNMQIMKKKVTDKVQKVKERVRSRSYSSSPASGAAGESSKSQEQTTSGVSSMSSEDDDGGGTVAAPAVDNEGSPLVIHKNQSFEGNRSLHTPDGDIEAQV